MTRLKNFRVSPVDRVRIAVDAMGGDRGPSVIVPGAVAAARELDFEVVLVGDEAAIRAELELLGEDPDAPAGKGRVRIRHASQVAGMREKASQVLRRMKDSSIQVACRLVSEGEADGVVSAGNSGATVACGMFIIGRIPGVDRPAFASIMPTEDKPMVLLDVGANVDCKPHQLLQFGIMADVLARVVLERPKPRIGLLSIGEEEGKGNVQVKEAFDLFKRSSLNFTGNAEGRDLFSGELDVVVCDGFVGNVALKLTEGLGLSLARILRRELTTTWLSRLGTLLAFGALRRFKKITDYATYGGAPFLGLKGICIVCHGASSVTAIDNATRMAARFVRRGANAKMVEALCANEELADSRERKKDAETPCGPGNGRATA